MKEGEKVVDKKTETDKQNRRKGIEIETDKRDKKNGQGGINIDRQIEREVN